MTFKTTKFGMIGRVIGVASVMAAIAATVRANDIPTTPSMRTGPSLTNQLRLRLHHLHTGESIDVAYKQNGEYMPGGVTMLNHFLRDHRTEASANYDPLEFDLLHSLLVRLGRPNAVIDIVCGYRSPESNQYLRNRSAFTGVAEHSQHILSKAIDIRIPGISTAALRDAALSLGMGGVGYYPTSQFVHVDVGPVREWQFGGRRMLMASNRVRVRHGGRHGRHRA